MTPERSDNLFFSDGGTERALLVEIVERLNSFINRWEGLQRDLSLNTYLGNPSVLREDTSLGDIF